jgi:hypothetical protein
MLKMQAMHMAVVGRQAKMEMDLQMEGFGETYIMRCWHPQSPGGCELSEGTCEERLLFQLPASSGSRDVSSEERAGTPVTCRRS